MKVTASINENPHLPDHAIGRVPNLKLFLYASAPTLGLCITIAEFLGFPSFVLDKIPGVAGWLLTVGLGALVSALVGTANIARHYRSRARMFRSQSLINAMYDNKTWLSGHYEEFIIRAKNEFICSGITLHSLCEYKGFPKLVRRALETHSSLHISLIFLDPDSGILKQREIEENRGVGRIAVDGRRHITDCLRLKNDLGKLGDRLHVHVSNKYAPVGFFLIEDQTMFFEPYLNGEVGCNCPVFRFQQNAHNQNTWRAFRDHVARLECRTERTGFGRVVPARVTDFGQTEIRKSIRNAIFLDRDGVLVKDIGCLKDPDDLQILPGVVDAIKRLSPHFRLVVVTNQGAIARGYMDESQLTAIHDKFLVTLNSAGALLDAIYYCPHHPNGIVSEYSVYCDCRKPIPGMLNNALEKFDLDASKSYMVGDKRTDLEAGRNAGVKPVLIGATGGECSDGYLYAGSLSHVADTILAELAMPA